MHAATAYTAVNVACPQYPELLFGMRIVPDGVLLINGKLLLDKVPRRLINQGRCNTIRQQYPLRRVALDALHIAIGVLPVDKAVRIDLADVDGIGDDRGNAATLPVPRLFLAVQPLGGGNANIVEESRQPGQAHAFFKLVEDEDDDFYGTPFIALCISVDDRVIERIAAFDLTRSVNEA